MAGCAILALMELAEAQAGVDSCNAILFVAHRLRWAPRVAATAVACALGRLCDKCGLNLEEYLRMARVMAEISAQSGKELLQ